jgi:hypothetical protein
VDSWQLEVSHLDKCIAWADPLSMRADVARHRSMVDEVVPRQIEEVGSAKTLLSRTLPGSHTRCAQRKTALLAVRAWSSK